MEYSPSRSEKKRQAKRVEQLTKELVNLSPSEIKKLPCGDEIKELLQETAVLKSGARKRQIKFITKLLRKQETSPLLQFLSEKKGSRLEKNKNFQELERLRDDIISDAIQAAFLAKSIDKQLDSKWLSPAIDAAKNRLPDLDETTIRTSALRFTRTRKLAHSREIFRTLKAAAEQLRFQTKLS